MPKRKRSGKSHLSPSARVMEPNAAGVDIGATEIYVAVPADRDPQPIRRFVIFTSDLERLAGWFKQCNIESVVMVSKGVFWIPFFQILEDYGFRICLVNARQLKNVTGRKTDVVDGQWLEYLHSVGLLRASHRPPQNICALRSLWRHRESRASVVTQNRQTKVSSGTLTPARGLVPSVGMASVLSEDKKQQVIALGRLGWSLRRIERATSVRRETASAYLKAAGVEVRRPGGWGRRSASKPAAPVASDLDVSKPAIEVTTDFEAVKKSNEEMLD